MHASIVFGVVNDEFEGEEYVTTNRGEVYQVMNTIVEIINDFIEALKNKRAYHYN